MTTQVSKGLKAKRDDLAEAMIEIAREAQPRPRFWVEPILRLKVPKDPEGELPAREDFIFVVDGSDDELETFHRKVRTAMAEFLRADPSLMLRVGMSTILPRQLSAVRS
jgi:hypothetical protein